ncbi:MAG: PepSY domain-containing protein [Ornithinimicrobium sp.]
MKANHKKAAVAAAAISGVLLAGGATIAAASPDGANSTSSSSTAQKDNSENEGTETGQDGKNERGEADFTGSIKAPAEAQDGAEAKDGSAQDTAQEKAEAATLAPLATVTESEASRAATDAVPGTVGTIALANQDGYVVWDVTVTQADGTVVEVVIDAGDASVLVQETADANELNGD